MDTFGEINPKTAAQAAVIERPAEEMVGKNTGKMIGIVFISVMVIVVTAGCAGQNRNNSHGNHPNENVNLSQPDLRTLMKQVAESEIRTARVRDVPDKAFADAEVFGIDKDGGKGTAYVYLNVAEYVAVKGGAYSMSGASGEAIIRFRYTAGGPKLTKVERSADGDLHDRWIKEHFSESCRRKRGTFIIFTWLSKSNGMSRLEENIRKEAQKDMGVPVETENFLNIDTDKGTYEIVKTTERGTPGKDYQFHSEIIEKGKLSDLAGK